MAARRLAPVATLALLLGACGGGGDDGIGAVSLSTPSKVLQAVAPAITTVEFDGSSAYAPGGTTSSARRDRQLRRAWLGAKGSRAGRAGGQGSNGPRDTITPCQDGGSNVYGDAVVKDVNSPFTDAAFEVQPVEERDCRTIVTNETGYTEYYNDGKYELGCPVDANCDIAYTKEGSADARARFSHHVVDGSFEFELSGSGYEVLHRKRVPDSTVRDEIRYGSFSWKSTYTDHESGDSGTGQLSGYVGTSSHPFALHTDGEGTTLDGPFALSADQAPDCELGAATLATLAPLRTDLDTGHVVGTVEVAAGSHSAVVDMNADGSVDVAIDGGAPQMLSAAQVQELRDACPFFPLY